MLLRCNTRTIPGDDGHGPPVSCSGVRGSWERHVAPPGVAVAGVTCTAQSVMAEKVLETDFPLIAPPNPPLSVHPRLLSEREHGRNGSLKRAYSSEELTPLHPGSAGSDTSDYLSDSQAPPGYQTLPPGSLKSTKTDSLTQPTFRPPTQR